MTIMIDHDDKGSPYIIDHWSRSFRASPVPPSKALSPESLNTFVTIDRGLLENFRDLTGKAADTIMSLLLRQGEKISPATTIAKLREMQAKIDEVLKSGTETKA